MPTRQVLAQWRIRIPAAEIDVVITPLLAGQELVAAGLPNLISWEGAVAGEGNSKGRRIAYDTALPRDIAEIEPNPGGKPT